MCADVCASSAPATPALPPPATKKERPLVILFESYPSFARLAPFSPLFSRLSLLDKKKTMHAALRVSAPAPARALAPTRRGGAVAPCNAVKEVFMCVTLVEGRARGERHRERERERERESEKRVRPGERRRASVGERACGPPRSSPTPPRTHAHKNTRHRPALSSTMTEGKIGKRWRRWRDENEK